MSKTTGIVLLIVLLCHLAFCQNNIVCPSGNNYKDLHLSDASFAAGGIGQDMFTDMTIFNNKLYAIGSFQNTIQIAGSSASCPTPSCSFVAVISSDLRSVNLGILPATDTLILSKIVVESDYNVFVTGRFKGTFNGVTSAGDFDILVMRFNLQTNRIVWMNTAGGTDYDEGNSLVIDYATSSVIVAGAFYNQARFSFFYYLTGTASRMNMFLAVYSFADGTVQNAASMRLNANANEAITSLEINYSTNQLVFSGNSNPGGFVGKIAKSLTGQIFYKSLQSTSQFKCSNLDNGKIYVAGSANGVLAFLIGAADFSSATEMTLFSATQPIRCRNEITSIQHANGYIYIVGTFSGCVVLNSFRLESADSGTYGFYAELGEDFNPILLKKFGLMGNNRVASVKINFSKKFVAGFVQTNGRTSIDVGPSRNYLGYGGADLFIDTFSYTCVPCTRGTVSDGVAICTPCDVGTFQSQSGKSVCDECKPGEYQDAKGATSCKQCEDGTFSDSFKSTTCSACKLYQISTENNTKCVLNSSPILLGLISMVCIVGLLCTIVTAVIVIVVLKKRKRAKAQVHFQQMVDIEPSHLEEEEVQFKEEEDTSRN